MMEETLTWLSANLGTVIIPVICVFLTYALTVRHERKKDRAASNKALQKENEDLLSQLQIYEATSSSQTGAFLVRKKDNEPICPVCWRAEHKAIPIYENSDTGYYTCGKCGQTGIFNRKKVQQLDAERESFNQQLSDTMMTSPYPEQDSSDFYEHYLNP